MKPGPDGNRDRGRDLTWLEDDGMDLFDDLPPAYPPVFGG